MNAIGADSIAMLHKGLKRLTTDFDAMVIANEAVNFSVGANLMLMLVAAQEQEWDEIHLGVKQFQNVNLALKYAPKPVVAAPHGLALGGGCEGSRTGDGTRRIQAGGGELAGRRADDANQSAGRAIFGGGEDGDSSAGAGRLCIGVRCARGTKAGKYFGGRAADRAADGQRTVRAGPGARGLCVALRGE